MPDLLLMELLNKYALVAFLILYLRIKQTYPPHHRQCWTTDTLSAFPSFARSALKNLNAEEQKGAGTPHSQLPKRKAQQAWLSKPQTGAQPHLLDESSSHPGEERMSGPKGARIITFKGSPPII